MMVGCCVVDDIEDGLHDEDDSVVGSINNLVFLNTICCLMALNSIRFDGSTTSIRRRRSVISGSGDT